MIKWKIKPNNYNLFIALGCVIKGETPHFDFICSSTFNAIQSLSVSYNKPIGNGIITALNINQAKQRSKRLCKLYDIQKKYVVTQHSDEYFVKP